MADAGAGFEHPLTAGLTAEQRDAVTTRASPLCIVAGAGSGKTRVLTRRIAWQISQGLADPRQVLAVTFTRKAAHELRSRLRRMGLRDDVKAGTFHSVAWAQLRRYDAERGRRPRRLVESTSQLVSELLRDKRRRLADHVSVAGASNEINWARARLVAPEGYAAAARAAGRRPPRGGAARFAALYADYEAAKLSRRMFDFNDVLLACLRVMSRKSKHAEAQRWLHRHLLVDEFQDVNPLQFALLKSWLGERSTLVVVGDPDQAIYGWNGADPELIGAVADHFEGCAVVRLRTNFRSTPEILAAAGRVLGRPAQPAFRPPGIEPAVAVCAGEEEAAVLARAVRDRQPPGAPWRRQAVLARTNGQLAPLRKALARQGIPVTARAENDLIRQPEVSALVRRWNGADGLAAAVIDARSEQALADGAGSADAGRAAIEALLGLADDCLALDPDATVRAFLAELRYGDRSFAARDGVSLMTFHAAKGLQWPIVHLVGLEDGFVPAAKARSREARAEERRLLYVAVTRAVTELNVMWCDRRLVGDQMLVRKPSPWLEAIAAPAAEGGAYGDGAARKGADAAGPLARARRALEAAEASARRGRADGGRRDRSDQDDQQALPL